jgi:hypothetical protein
LKYAAFRRRAEPLQQLRQLGDVSPIILALLSRVGVLKQRFGPVAPAVKFVHWICEEMDQRFAGYSVEPAI